MLERAGVDVTVLEREPQLAEDLRASTWHPPTLDMMETLGFVDEILAKGLIARHFQHRDRRSGAIAEFDLELLAPGGHAVHFAGLALGLAIVALEFRRKEAVA